ncbi:MULTISPECIES: Gfo/Idh/MocA family protein [Gracilibacillus]|uniref:Gfo/Idh/MocA family protein n=1 Tax=Gracilibacillus TaxID=74385 RepID=UPI000824AC1C|nr:MULTISPECIES: Gfo/Idh/MocA family oxidoreductase [Gracilibacillus]
MSIKWGILSTATIAKNAVIPGIKESEAGEVYAIASRSLENAKQTAEELVIPNAYGSYEALLADPEIEVVYVPLPNHLHKNWAIKAMQAGKHVLCEKPIALDAKEAEEMATVSEQTGKIIVEAFMYRYHPRYQMIQKVIESGEIGDIRGIHGTFTFNSAANKENVRFRKAWGGGSIYDIGVYPISAARMLLNEEPQAATVHALFSKEHDDVDMMASGILEFNHGVALTFDCGMWAAGRNQLEILGTKGRIEVPSAFVAHQDEKDHFQLHSQDGVKEITVPHVNQYALQADVIAESIRTGAPLPYPIHDAILNMRVVDACLESADKRQRIEIMEG